jgi:putative ABC transport system permease protein
MFFFTYLRRELRRRMRQAIMIAVGLALGIGLVITVTAMTAGVRSAQGKVLGALYGVGTDITVTTATAPASASGSGSFGGGPTPKPYVQHTDTLGSPTLGTLRASAVAAISRLRDVAGAAGGLVLTEIKSTVPADNQPPPSSFQPPTQVSVVGVDLGHDGLGPFSAARLIAGHTFAASQADADAAVLDSAYAAAHRLRTGSTVTIAGAPFRVIGIVRQSQGSSPPELYVPLGRAQALSKLAGHVNTVYVAAASSADVNAVSGEVSRLMPSATVTNSASLANGVAGSLATTAKLASRLGTWLAALALLAAFALASLLTLAAVSRRVREFGTLKALGWRSSRITGQVMGESVAMGIAGAALGVAAGLVGALLASAVAPKLSATVQNTNVSKGGFGGSLGAGGATFHGTVGGPVQTFANPNATHTVLVPFSAPVTLTAIVLGVVLAIAGALVAGSLGGWQITRLRPAIALARVE